MRRITTFLCGLGIAHSLFFAASANADWFVNQSVYSEAHKYLLQGKTAQAFGSIVEAWQQSPNYDQESNLNDLLDLAIGEDCGHSLDKAVLPTWLSKLSIERAVVQNINQQILKLSIVGLTRVDITQITFSKYPNYSLIDATPVIDDGGYFTVEAHKLDHKVEAGLYKLTIVAKGEPVWNKWVVLNEPPAKQTLGWKDSNSWRIDQIKKPNTSCPAPILSIKMYDLNDTDWRPLWSEEVDTRLPTELPKLNIPEGRYWLDVGLIQSRWQGELSILDIQSITRPIDYSDDELE
ncbi:DUF2861 family protein [Photobacterium leiognathi]|uniref:DUF2861 family protein n=1 Tax=Photobacterium leiognathi TaxID=553611 RepID=UPI002981A9F6|nr:DUF2861 family protein [Photobacterium leiognathi]